MKDEISVKRSELLEIIKTKIDSMIDQSSEVLEMDEDSIQDYDGLGYYDSDEENSS